MISLEVLIPDFDMKLKAEADERISAVDFKNYIVRCLDEKYEKKLNNATLIDVENMEVIGEHNSLLDAGITSGTRILFICE